MISFFQFVDMNIIQWLPPFIMVAARYFHDEFTWLKGLGLFTIIVGVSLFSWYNPKCILRCHVWKLIGWRLEKERTNFEADWMGKEKTNFPHIIINNMSRIFSSLI